MAERGGGTQFAVAGWLFGSVSVALGLLIHGVSGHPVPAAPIVVATAALLSLAGTVVIRIGVPNWALLVLAGVPTQPLHVLLYAHVAAALLVFRLIQRLKTSDPKRFSPGAAAYPR